MSEEVQGSQRAFSHWLVGSIAAMLCTLPACAVAILGWFVQLPGHFNEAMATARASGPPSVLVQALVLLGLVTLAGVSGAFWAEMARRRADPMLLDSGHDRHPAAEATRAGLIGFGALVGLLVIIMYVTMRRGGDIFYLAFGYGGSSVLFTLNIAVIFAISGYHSLVTADTWFARWVWRIAKVPAEARSGRMPARTGGAWTPARIAGIVLCLGLGWLVGRAEFLPIALRIVGREPSNVWWNTMVVEIGLNNIVAPLLWAIGAFLWLRGYELADAREEREAAMVTSLRLGILARKPILAGLFIGVGVALFGSLAIHFRVLEDLDAQVGERLLAARSRLIENIVVALAPQSEFISLPLQHTRPTRLAQLIEKLEEHLSQDAFVVMCVSFEDLRRGTKYLKPHTPTGQESAQRFVEGSFEQEMRTLQATLEKAEGVFFLVASAETDPRQYGVHSAQTGWFEADRNEPERPFRTRLREETQSEHSAALAPLIAAHVLGISREQVASDGNELRIGTTAIALDDEGRALISAGRIMTGEAPGNCLPDDIRYQVADVLHVGGYSPVYMSSPSTFGDPDAQFRLKALDRTVAALVAEALPDKAPEMIPILTESRVIRPAPEWVNLLILWALCLWGGAMSASFRPWWTALLTLFMVVIVLVGLRYVAAAFNILASPTVPLLAMFGVWAYGSNCTQGIIARTREQVKGTLGRYVSQQVAEEILTHEEITLGGKRGMVTVLFADIRGFGRLAEHLAPEDVVALLNDHFSVMIDVIFEFNGTLDKFIGDAVMALWGAPVQDPEDTVNAVRAAVAIRDRTNELAQKRVAEGKPVAEVAIGVNTGEAVAGNIGDIRRMEYTVIGDEVVVAARLQEIASRGPAYIVIGESTYEEVKDIVEVRSLGSVEVRHREQPVQIYELLDLR